MMTLTTEQHFERVFEFWAQRIELIDDPYGGEFLVRHYDGEQLIRESKLFQLDRAIGEYNCLVTKVCTDALDLRKNERLLRIVACAGKNLVFITKFGVRYEIRHYDGDNPEDTWTTRGRADADRIAESCRDQINGDYA